MAPLNESFQFDCAPANTTSDSFDPRSHIDVVSNLQKSPENELFEDFLSSAYSINWSCPKDIESSIREVNIQPLKYEDVTLEKIFFSFSTEGFYQVVACEEDCFDKLWPQGIDPSPYPYENLSDCESSGFFIELIDKYQEGRVEVFHFPKQKKFMWVLKIPIEEIANSNMPVISCLFEKMVLGTEISPIDKADIIKALNPC